MLHYSDLKFISGTKFTMTKESSFELIKVNKVPVMDFFLAKSIIATTNIKSILFTGNKELAKVEFTNLMIARSATLFFMVFLLRGKVYFDNKDSLPNFCRSVFHINDVNEYKKYVTNNNLTKLDYSWLLSLNWSEFCEPIKVRLLLGIAGYRSMKVFKAFPCIDNLDNNLKIIFDIVKKKANQGVMLEYHPYFNNNKGLNLAKNLNQLMLKVISRENLELAKNNGLIFAIPIEDLNCNGYMAWDSDTLKYLSTSIEDLMYPELNRKND
jgi:hypothetical protein